MNYGDIILSIRVSNWEGEVADVVLRFDNMEEYMPNPFLNAMVGGFANRIANGTFTLNGKTNNLRRMTGLMLCMGNGLLTRWVWNCKPLKVSQESHSAIRKGLERHNIIMSKKL